MLKILNLLLAAVIFTALSCSSSEDAENFKFGKGKYRYKMSDSTGKALIDGIITVKTYENGEITGTLLVTKNYVNDFPGYTSMSNEFSGNVNLPEKKVFINTNPRIADSNVFWNMDIKTSGLSGEWRYSVFRGKTSTGKVKIMKY
ncbi:MAG TPA: hypothetical protein PK536_06645 [Ignavibacteria bacterium]|nr:hypothetical protein [Ignavibacteria bacterium]HRK00295.1 hypothetical protein [Ignavibacteria bacterium]